MTTAKVIDLKRQLQTVPWTDYADLLEVARDLSGHSDSQITTATGYNSAGQAAQWAREGSVPLRAKLALQGLLTTYGWCSAHPFTRDELIELLTLAAQARKLDLVQKIAKEIGELT